MSTFSKIYIDQGLFALNYNLIEKSKILFWLLNQRSIDRPKIVAEYLPKLGLEPHESVLDYQLELLHLTAQLSEKVTKFELALKLAVRLSRLPEGDQDALAKLVQKFSLNANEFKKIYEMLEDLSLRESRKISEIILELDDKKKNIDSWVAPSGLLRMIRERLEQRLNPHLVAQRQKWIALKKELSLPSGIRISDPQSFEESYLTLEVRAISQEDLSQKFEKIKKNNFDSLFDLL
ncbi:MAG: hypothetical protein HYS98_01880 [Deltaproteobacteria bacterium]|nr:hypothetical protein [Deltaproteobacteria bacterium]